MRNSLVKLLVELRYKKFKERETCKDIGVARNSVFLDFPTHVLQVIFAEVNDGRRTNQVSLLSARVVCKFRGREPCHFNLTAKWRHWHCKSASLRHWNFRGSTFVMQLLQCVCQRVVDNDTLGKLYDTS